MLQVRFDGGGTGEVAVDGVGDDLRDAAETLADGNVVVLAGRSLFVVFEVEGIGGVAEFEPGGPDGFVADNVIPEVEDHFEGTVRGGVAEFLGDGQNVVGTVAEDVAFIFVVEHEAEVAGESFELLEAGEGFFAEFGGRFSATLWFVVVGEDANGGGTEDGLELAEVFEFGKVDGEVVGNVDFAQGRTIHENGDAGGVELVLDFPGVVERKHRDIVPVDVTDIDMLETGLLESSDLLSSGRTGFISKSGKRNR